MTRHALWFESSGLLLLAYDRVVGVPHKGWLSSECKDATQAGCVIRRGLADILRIGLLCSPCRNSGQRHPGNSGRQPPCQLRHHCRYLWPSHHNCSAAGSRESTPFTLHSLLLYCMHGSLQLYTRRMMALHRVRYCCGCWTPHCMLQFRASASLMSVSPPAGATIGSIAGAALIAGAAIAATRRMRKKPETPETMATFNQAYNSNA